MKEIWLPEKLYCVFPVFTALTGVNFFFISTSLLSTVLSCLLSIYGVVVICRRALEY